MLDQILPFAVEYGPFPLGIITGIFITRRVDNKILDMMQKEKEALRQEKKELLELIDIKDDRIEALHNQLPLGK